MKSILAGFVIAIGCVVNGMVSGVCGAVCGAVFFGVGLLSVTVNQLTLYTGSVYKIRNNLLSPTKLLKIWFGNLIGVLILAGIILLSPQREQVQNFSQQVLANRGYLDSLLLGIPCGLLMTFAVRSNNNTLYIIFCVAGFILAGFRHCIADMFYTVMGFSEWQSIIKLLLVTIGNTIGGLLGYVGEDKVPVRLFSPKKE